MSDTAVRRLMLGSGPDSWGVWYADDPRQLPWDRFLDEIAEVGYQWIELGPYGYLPTDHGQLADERQPRRDPGPDRAVPSTRPTPVTSRCAWTRATSPTVGPTCRG